MPLRQIIEWATQFQTGLTRAEVIEEGRKKLFDFSYPIASDYKKEFETKFIRHFYFKEIGFETEGHFKFELESWLNLHMPYYNQLIETTHLEYDPLYNVDYKRDHDSDRSINQKDIRKTDTVIDSEGKFKNQQNGDSTTKQDQTSSQRSDAQQIEKNKDLREDTPDDRLSIINDDNIIQSASEIKQNDNKKESYDNINSQGNSNQNTKTLNTSSGDTQNNTTGNNIDDFTSDKDDKLKTKDHVYGKQGNMTYPQMIKEHREALLRIEQMIFREMSELFMLVY